MNENPLVMCLTNYVAADFTANALLAIGAKPAMVEEPSEAAELAKIADAALINLGTVHPRQAEAMLAAIDAINHCQPSSFNLQPSTPWVLDPVACHQLSYRGKFATELIAKNPTLIRGNHAEIDWVLKSFPDANAPMLSTGEIDKIYFSTTPHSSLLTPHSCIHGGVPMLQMVTATGCTQGAICAAMLGRGMSPMEAAEAASKLMKRAGEMAWDKTKEPGSFKVALIDALYDLSRRDI